MRRKRKIKKLLILILMLIIFITLILIKKYKNKSVDKKIDNIDQATIPNEKEEKNINNIDYTNFITTESENNPELIAEYLSNGINIDNFKLSLSRITTYLEKTNEKYSEINYNFENHLKYEELEKLYKNLNKSDAVNIEIIGTSYDGRNIYSIEIGYGEEKILFEGNIHAAEIAPALFLTKLATNLVNKYESQDNEIVNLLQNKKIIIVPTINPDGYDYSIFGKDIINDKTSYTYVNANIIDRTFYKANINGVDLNRNFPSELGGLYFKNHNLYYTVSRKKSTELLEYFPGDELGSEPETQALIYWMYKHYKNTYAYLAIHSAGRVIYSNMQYYSDTFNSLTTTCAEIISKYTNYIDLGYDYDDGYGSDGNSTDMISEIAHGLKLSENTGRLSYISYDKQMPTMEKEMCVLTVETLTNYTQNLDTIKNEWYNHNLEKAFIEVAKLK